MKKLLLLGAAALTAAGAMAAEPRIVDNAAVMAIAPDGSFFISNIYGHLSIINTADGSIMGEWGSQDEEYSAGYGTCVSSDGTIAGATPLAAAYYKNGVWTELNVPKLGVMNFANGITPDGKMIVGTVGTTELTTEDTPEPMVVPAYWVLQEDGTYSECHILPYPAVDFSGRVPQYVVAISPSADGNTIAGYLRDYSGYFNQPIVFHRNADGEWEYTIDNSFPNPDHLVFPEYPGEYSDYPEAKDYMTEEEIEAYNEALNAYWSDGGNYPDYVDFMSDEEKTEYEAAVAAWEAGQEEWQVKYDAFEEVLVQCLQNGRSIEMNDIKVTPAFDKIYSTTQIIEDDEDPWQITVTNTPIIFDMTTLSPTTLDPKNVAPSSIGEDGTIFGFRDEQMVGRFAMVYLPGAEEPITLKEYFQAVNPETASWIEENMTHEIMAYDPETWEPFTKNVELTGMPIVTPDLSTVVTFVENSWDWDSDVYYFSYILPGKASGVKAVENGDTLKVKALKGGRIYVSDTASEVTVYDMNGAIVFRAEPKSTLIQTGLNSGAYIVKVASKDDSKVLKVIF